MNLQGHTARVHYAEVEKAWCFMEHGVALNALRNAALCASDPVFRSFNAAHNARSVQTGSTAGTPYAAYQHLLDEGWGCVSVSQEIGGQGLPLVLQSALSEIFFSAIPELWFSVQNTMLGLELIDRFAPERLRSELIPRMLSGDLLLVLGHGLVHPHPQSPPQAAQAVPQGEGLYTLYGSERHFTQEDASAMGLIQIVDADVQTDGDLHAPQEKAIFMVISSLATRGARLAACQNLQIDGLGIEPGQRINTRSRGATAWKLANLPEAGPLLGQLRRIGRHLSVMKALAALRTAVACELVNGSMGTGSGKRIAEKEDASTRAANRASRLEAVRAIAYAYAASMDIANLHPDEEVRRSSAYFISLSAPVLDEWLLSVQMGLEEDWIRGPDAGDQLATDGSVCGTPTQWRHHQIAYDMIANQFVADGGETFRGWLQSVHEGILRLDRIADRTLAETRLPLRMASELLQNSVAWSIAHFAQRPLEVYTRSKCLLALLAAVMGASEMAKLAMAVHQEQVPAGTRSATIDFAQTLVHRTRHFTLHDLAAAYERAHDAFAPI